MKPHCLLLTLSTGDMAWDVGIVTKGGAYIGDLASKGKLERGLVNAQRSAALVVAWRHGSG